MAATSGPAVPSTMPITTPDAVVLPDELLAQLRRRYPCLVLATTWGTRALRYHPGDALGHGVDFVTIEERDRALDAPAPLDAMGAYRVSFAVAPARFEALFGAPPVWGAAADATRVDTIVPHPLYAWMSWAAVVNPSPATVERLWPLLDEGYALARAAHARRGASGSPQRVR